MMGHEGFNEGGVEKGGIFQSEAASALIKSSVTVSSSPLLLSKKEPSFWRKAPDANSGFHDELSFNNVNIGITMTPVIGDNQRHKKSGKLARVNNGSCKRSRLAQVEISVSESVLEKEKGNCSEPVTDLSGVPKQKNISKRGEKRNGRTPKSRGDTFSLRNGLVSFSSASGGNSFIGSCNSKPNLFDVTEHIDDLSLNELLDGSYKCPSYSKDKGKQVTTSNENLLLSVRKACSICEIQKHALSKKTGEYDKSSAELSCSGSSSANRCNTGNGDVQTAECTSSLEVQESNKNLNSTMAALVNLPLNQPKEVLNRLSLPPSKDLDSLLLDAVKPALSSRNNSELRSGKLGPCRSGLPPFSWSQSSSVQSKSVSDAVKSTTSKNSCQGRWVKVENSANHPNDSHIVVDLESLTFDKSLVPSLSREMYPPQTEKSPSASSIIPINQIENSSALCLTSHDQPDEHPPSVVGAAETLYAIASGIQTPNGTSKWHNKPAEKQLSRMYKSKAKNRESGYKFVEPKATPGPDSITNADALIRCSKKLKLSVDVRSNKISGTYSSKKYPLSSSALRSLTSSPIPSKLKSTIPEMRNGSTNVVNRSCIMPPPPSRVMDNACVNQLKLR